MAWAAHAAITCESQRLLDVNERPSTAGSYSVEVLTDMNVQCSDIDHCIMIRYRRSRRGSAVTALE